MKHRITTGPFVIGICILLLAHIAHAAAPKLMSYQGKATDASGNPVANGFHNVRFDLYNASTAGQSVWNEEATVTTSGGLFSHTLGSVTPIATSYFSNSVPLYLQVTFEGEVQSPRTQMTSVGYAFRVETVDGSDGGVVNEYIAVHSDYADDEVAGIQATPGGNGNVWLKDIDGNNRIELNAETRSLDFYDFVETSTPATISSSGSQLTLSGGGVFFGNPTGDSAYALVLPDYSGNRAGDLLVYGDGGTTALFVDGNFDGTGYPCTFFTGRSAAVFNMGATGNSSIELPNDAIKSNEIANEAGVGSYINESGYEVTTPAGQLTYLGSRVMFTPSAGYVLVMASAEVQIHHSPPVTDALTFGITDNCASLYASSKISLQLPGAVPAGFYYLPVTVHALFPVDSGTTVFCFMVDNESGSYAKKVENIAISELFVPTAYTTVIQPSASNQPLDSEEERAAELSFHETRLQAELDQMKTEVAAIKEALQSVQEETRKD